MNINISAPSAPVINSPAPSYTIPVSALAAGYAPESRRPEPPPAAPVQAAHSAPAVTFTVGQSLDEIERAMIIRTMQATRGNRTRAAKMLGISVRTLYTKLLALESKAAQLQAILQR